MLQRRLVYAKINVLPPRDRGSAALGLYDYHLVFSRAGDGLLRGSLRVNARGQMVTRELVREGPKGDKCLDGGPCLQPVVQVKIALPIHVFTESEPHKTWSRREFSLVPEDSEENVFDAGQEIPPFVDVSILADVDGVVAIQSRIVRL